MAENSGLQKCSAAGECSALEGHLSQESFRRAPCLQEPLLGLRSTGLNRELARRGGMRRRGLFASRNRVVCGRTLAHAGHLLRA